MLAATPAATPGFQLPNTVVPRKYSLDLTIDPAQPYFTGVARIEVELLVPTKTIWLNAKDLTIQKVSLDASNAQPRIVNSELLAVDLPASLGPVKSAVLSLSYRGRLQDHMVLGPYRRKIGADWYVYTTFTPIEARRAFPCFDEPRFKTPWEVSIRVPTQQRAFSNGAQVSESDDGLGNTLFRFAPTAR